MKLKTITKKKRKLNTQYKPLGGDEVVKIIQESLEKIPTYESQFEEIDKKLTAFPGEVNQIVDTEIKKLPEPVNGKDAKITDALLEKIKHLVINDGSLRGNIDNVINSRLKEPQFKGKNLLYKNLSSIEKQTLQKEISELIDTPDIVEAVSTAVSYTVDYDTSNQVLSLLADKEIISKTKIPVGKIDDKKIVKIINEQLKKIRFSGGGGGVGGDSTPHPHGQKVGFVFDDEAERDQFFDDNPNLLEVDALIAIRLQTTAITTVDETPITTPDGTPITTPFG